MHVAERSLRHKDKETDHRVGAEEPGRSINMLNLLAYMTLPYDLPTLSSSPLRTLLLFNFSTCCSEIYCLQFKIQFIQPYIHIGYVLKVQAQN